MTGDWSVSVLVGGAMSRRVCLRLRHELKSVSLNYLGLPAGLTVTSSHQHQDNSTHAGEARLQTTRLCEVLALCPLVSII